MGRKPLSDAPTRDIGRYRLAHRIAVGGMAEVFRALWPQSAGGDRSVVIKRLRKDLLDDAERRAMFEDEIRLGSRIDHPNVVAVLDHGIDGDAPYMVLEHVFGVDLWQLVRWLNQSGRSFETPRAVWVTTQILAGLEAVHALEDDRGSLLHVVHRDVSPSNVFLSVHGDVKLGDLGIARGALRDMEGTAAARAKGKLGYLSPEQVSGRAVDARADVFATAVVLAELLLGRPLFRGGTELAVLLAIRDADVRPLKLASSKLPEGLTDVVLAALERRPEHRTQTAARFRDELAPFIVTPESRCRRGLGTQVVAALDAQATDSDRQALAETRETNPDWLDRKTPAEGTETPFYEVERAGEPLGNFGLAELVRAVTIGQVKPTDRVSCDGGVQRSVGQVPEIAGHIPVSTRTPTARNRIEIGETGERWDLTRRSIIAVLAEVLLAREDGLLLCERGEVRKEVYLEGGVPRYVTSNQPAELFGEQLVAQGAIDRAELDLSLAAMPRFEGRLGETFVALGLLEPVDLVHHLSEHVQTRLLHLFEWDEGHAALYRELDRPERAFRLDLDPWEVLERGAERRIEAGLEAKRFEGRGMDVLMRTAPELDTAVPDELLEIWTACAAPRSLRELEDLAPSADLSRARIVVLLEIGALRWRGDGAGS